jgi:hypothetical protein
MSLLDNIGLILGGTFLSFVLVALMIPPLSYSFAPHLQENHHVPNLPAKFENAW